MNCTAVILNPTEENAHVYGQEVNYCRSERREIQAFRRKTGSDPVFRLPSTRMKQVGFERRASQPDIIVISPLWAAEKFPAVAKAATQWSLAIFKFLSSFFGIPTHQVPTLQRRSLPTPSKRRGTSSRA